MRDSQRDAISGEYAPSKTLGLLETEALYDYNHMGSKTKGTIQPTTSVFVLVKDRGSSVQAFILHNEKTGSVRGMSFDDSPTVCNSSIASEKRPLSRQSLFAFPCEMNHVHLNSQWQRRYIQVGDVAKKIRMDSEVYEERREMVPKLQRDKP